MCKLTVKVDVNKRVYKKYLYLHKIRGSCRTKVFLFYRKNKSIKYGIRFKLIWKKKKKYLKNNSWKNQYNFLFSWKILTRICILPPDLLKFQTLVSRQPYIFDIWFFGHFWITFQGLSIDVIQSSIWCYRIFPDHSIFFLSPITFLPPKKWKIDAKIIHPKFLVNMNAYWGIATKKIIIIKKSYGIT